MSRPPRVARVYLVRHGRAEGGDGRAVGQTDLPLADEGRRAVERLAASWSGSPPDRLVTSPRARAVATAEIFAVRWGLTPTPEPRLAEIDFGTWEGLTWDEIHASDGERFAAWAARWWEAATPDGEGFPALVERAGGWLDDELAFRPSRVTVAVSHAGPIRALLAGRLGMPLMGVWDQPIGPARVTALAAGRPRPRLLFVDRPAF